MIRRLTPKIILVYGSAPDKFFGKYRKAGIQIIEYPSRTNVAFEKRQKPNKKFLEDWTDITHPEARKNSDNIKYEHKKTGLRVRFDLATPESP